MPNTTDAAQAPARVPTADDKGVRTVVENYLALMDDSAVAVLPHALRITAELNVPDALRSGPARVDDVARRLSLDPAALYRLLRAMSTAGFFDEVTPRTFALTGLGERLYSTGTGSAVRSLSNLDSCRAWHTGAAAIRTGTSAFRHAHGDDFFGCKDTFGAANEAFLQRMRERARRLYPFVAATVDWGASRVVMDVGGGDGYLIGEVLRQAPHVEGVLFDRPAVVDLLDRSGARPAPVDRCRLVGGDFAVELPKGADTHLMASVLHDWPDEPAVTILRNSRAALPDHGRLLIVDMLMPADGRSHPSVWSDLAMLVLTGGQERTAAEFDRLLGAAGFDRVSTSTVPGSFFSLIEARP